MFSVLCILINYSTGKKGAEWGPWYKGAHRFVPKEIPFSGTPGPQDAAAQMEEDAHAADFYELLVTDTMLEHVAAETNRYALLCISKVSRHRLTPPRGTQFNSKKLYWHEKT